MLLLLALFPIKTDEGVRFTYFAPDARTVFIAGDFNGWGRTPMEMDENGFWTIVIELRPGRYEYKYIVDGEWVSDPDNPVVSGGYQNSVIVVNKNGDVLMPYTSSISFSGVNRMMMQYEKDSLSLMDIDVIFDINLFLSSVEAWTRLRYSGSIYLQRAEARYGSGKTHLGVFYNTYALKSDDPFHIVGNIGKYRDSLGRDYTGIYLSDGENMLFYSNSINDGADIYGIRIKPKFQHYYGGFTAQIKDWYGYETEVDSPITWYSRKKKEHLGLDIGAGNFVIDYDWQSEYRGIYKYEIGGTQSDTSLYKRLYRRSRIHIEYGIKTGKVWVRYAELLFPDGAYYSSIQPGIFLKHRGFWVKLSNLYFIKGQGLDWDYLFYHSFIQKLMISQYLCTGYRELTEMRFGWNGKFRYVKAGFEGILTKPGILSEYLSLELNPYFRTRGKVGVGGDIRYMRYKWPDFNTDFTTPFLYLFYRPSGNSEFRISLGLDPYDFEDQKRARETYLENRGVSLNAIKNYTGFTNILQQAEKSLADYKTIELRATVRFP